jgi:hypothetical protein
LCAVSAVAEKQTLPRRLRSALRQARCRACGPCLVCGRVPYPFWWGLACYALGFVLGAWLR